jgi:hypothetical protein
MANERITLTSSDRVSEIEGAGTTIPIEFTIEIADDRTVRSIVARDADGNEYVVSLKLHREDDKGACCCVEGGVLVCNDIPRGQLCSCDPK